MGASTGMPRIACNYQGTVFTPTSKERAGFESRRQTDAADTRDALARLRPTKLPGKGNSAKGRLIDDLEAHLAGGTRDNAETRFIAARVQVFGLRFHDIHDLFARHFADLRLVRLFRAGGDVRGLLQQDRGRRTLGDEGKRLVLKNGDDDGQNVAGLLLGGRVKFLAERHDVDAAWSERGTDRRRRVPLPSRDLEFDVSNYFLRHNVISDFRLPISDCRSS